VCALDHFAVNVDRFAAAAERKSLFTVACLARPGKDRVRMYCRKPYVEDVYNRSRDGHFGTGIFEGAPAT
jgi:hypothetical protein